MERDLSKSLNMGERAQKIVSNAKREIGYLNPEDRHASVKQIMMMNRSIRLLNGLEGQISKEKMVMRSTQKAKRNAQSVSQHGERAKRDLIA